MRGRKKKKTRTKKEKKTFLPLLILERKDFVMEVVIKKEVQLAQENH